MLATLGLRFLLTPQGVGAEVAFHDDGFTLRMRAFLRRDRCHRLTWTDIEEVTLIEAPRGSDLLAFRLTPEAAIGV